MTVFIMVQWNKRDGYLFLVCLFGEST